MAEFIKNSVFQILGKANSTAHIDFAKLDKIKLHILQKYNFDLSGYVEASLARRMELWGGHAKLNTVDELIAKLNDANFFYEFLNNITVNTTEMFRDPAMWKVFKNEYVGHLDKLDKIKIWHAACSTGEEVYSMAILLKKMGLLHKCQIHATDINDKVLEIAKQGKYDWNLFKKINHENMDTVFEGSDLIKSFFNREGSLYVVPDELKQNITFSKHNLTADPVHNKYDLIFCRNVLIYFNGDMQSQVINLFKESMFSGAILIVGNKETIAWTKDSENFDTLDAFQRIYKKK